MWLATQNVEDFAAPNLLRTVIESCPTKLFLSNPNLDVARTRELFHLNHTEAARIRDGPQRDRREHPDDRAADHQAGQGSSLDIGEGHHDRDQRAHRDRHGDRRFGGHRAQRGELRHQRDTGCDGAGAAALRRRPFDHQPAAEHGGDEADRGDLAHPQDQTDRGPDDPDGQDHEAEESDRAAQGLRRFAIHHGESASGQQAGTRPPQCTRQTLIWRGDHWYPPIGSYRGGTRWVKGR